MLKKLKDVYRFFWEFFFERQLGRFLVVGGIAFIVNEFLLLVLHGELHFNLLLAQIIAAELSIFVSFSIHHNWTYKHYRQRSVFIRFLHFNGSALGGTIINTITLLVTVHFFHIPYLLGFAIGALLALFWNYFANKYFVWATLVEE